MPYFQVTFAGPIFTRPFDDLTAAIAWALPQLPLKRGWATETERNAENTAARVRVLNSKGQTLPGYGCAIRQLPTPQKGQQ